MTYSRALGMRKDTNYEGRACRLEMLRKELGIRKKWGNSKMTSRTEVWAYAPSKVSDLSPKENKRRQYCLVL